MLRGIALSGMLLLNAAPQALPPDDALTIRLPGETIRADRETYRLPGTSLLDADKLQSLAGELERRIYREPKNAMLNGAGRIVPEQPGVRLDARKFADLFFSYYYGDGPGDITAPARPIAPAVDSELLAHISERQIGQYTTYYNARNLNRAHNIDLAAAAINNQVVFPGETFSFNRVVGQRTREKGYREAPIIVRGELSEGVGGGICQVSSTLYNAVDSAGMQIVERYSHSKTVPYVRPRRDATVSWGGPDFVFRNPYNQPILIRAYALHGRVRIVVLSSDLIVYKPREIAGMNERLPEEVPARRTHGHQPGEQGKGASNGS